MDIRRIAGIVYAAATAVVAAFQIALALGAPWGAYAMGGAFPGQFPPTMRVGERMLWAPVALVLLVCSLLVATGPKP